MLFCFKHEEHNYYLNNILFTYLSLPNLWFIKIRHHLEFYSFHMVNNQSINRTIGLVNVRQSFQGKTAIETDTNKAEICGPFFKSSDFFGCIWGNINLEKENVLSHLTLKLLCFARTSKHTLKVGLSKAIGCHFHKMLCGPEEFSGILRNRSLLMVNNNLVLDYYVGSTFSTDSHKKDPRKLRKLSANSKRRVVGGINSRWEFCCDYLLYI